MQPPLHLVIYGRITVPHFFDKFYLISKYAKEYLWKQTVILKN